MVITDRTDGTKPNLPVCMHSTNARLHERIYKKFSVGKKDLLLFERGHYVDIGFKHTRKYTKQMTQV